MNREYETLKYNEVDQVGELIINRPDKYNALNSKVLAELKTFLVEAGRKLLDEGYFIRILKIRGMGEKAFIAGADIKEMSSMDEVESKKMAQLGQEVTLLLEGLSIPTVAMVNGFALGGGCEMAMACDVIYCTMNSVFGQPEVKLGLIPGFGGCLRLSKLVGRNYAREMIYSGEHISAQKAKSIGLVLEVFDTFENLEKAVDEFCEKVKNNSPKAIAAAKKVLNAGADITLHNGLQVEGEEFAKCFLTDDMKEGTSSFIEKRKPNFKGK